MFLFQIFFIGQLFKFSASNYLKSDPNPESNSAFRLWPEDCEDGEEPEVNCFCYDEPNTDFKYSICPEPQGMQLCIVFC